MPSAACMATRLLPRRRRAAGARPGEVSRAFPPRRSGRAKFGQTAVAMRRVGALALALRGLHGATPRPTPMKASVFTVEYDVPPVLDQDQSQRKYGSAHMAQDEAYRSLAPSHPWSNLSRCRLKKIMTTRTNAAVNLISTQLLPEAPRHARRDKESEDGIAAQHRQTALIAFQAASRHRFYASRARRTGRACRLSQHA